MKLKSRLALALLAALTLAPALAAQEKPNPALQRLAVLAGEWTIKATIPPATEVTGKTTYELFPGGFFFIQRSEVNMGGAIVHSMEIVGWNEAQKALVSVGIGNLNSQLGSFKWDMTGDTLTISSGGMSYQGKLSKDKKTLKGKWEWTENGAKKGYEVISTKVK